jgi:hypothetical protein
VGIGWRITGDGFIHVHFNNCWCAEIIWTWDLEACRFHVRGLLTVVRDQWLTAKEVK